MELKKLPSKRLYWSHTKPLFRCSLISQWMSRDRYELITRCLHVANALAEVQDPSSPSYDKLHKLQWMIDEVCNRFRAMWSPNQQLTIDEGMVMYKGKYCPIRQYLPKKPVRFGIKVWAAANALSKYLWDFEIYCGKSRNPHDDDSATLSAGSEVEGSDGQQPRAVKGEGFTGQNVVKRVMHNLGGRGHIVTTDNYFTSVPLFLDLLENGTMAIGTLRGNRKYVPRSMFAKKVTKKNI
jgi:hypothetical protein